MCTFLIWVQIDSQLVTMFFTFCYHLMILEFLKAIFKGTFPVFSSIYKILQFS